VNIKSFIVDYCQRHAHPVNGLLHLIGIPVVFYGLYWLFEGKPIPAVSFIALGYFFQYLGHRAQNNEVGEVILIKKCIRFLANKFKQDKDKQNDYTASRATDFNSNTSN
jgi:Protein of unknown function (DUF962)